MVVVTWNLQGSKGVDTAAVARAVRSLDADVLLLQEIQRRQADALAKELGWSVRWAEKHSAPFIAAEGLAILAPGGIEQSAVLELRGGPRRSWRRRIALIAAVSIGGTPFVFADVHLSPGDDDRQRDEEIDRLLRFLQSEPWAGRPAATIGGDFNAPSSRSILRTVEHQRLAGRLAGGAGSGRGRVDQLDTGPATRSTANAAARSGLRAIGLHRACCQRARGPRKMGRPQRPSTAAHCDRGR